MVINLWTLTNLQYEARLQQLTPVKLYAEQTNGNAAQNGDRG